MSCTITWIVAGYTVDTSEYGISVLHILSKHVRSTDESGLDCSCTRKLPHCSSSVVPSCRIPPRHAVASASKKSYTLYCSSESSKFNFKRFVITCPMSKLPDPEVASSIENPPSHRSLCVSTSSFPDFSLIFTLQAGAATPLTLSFFSALLMLNIYTSIMSNDTVEYRFLPTIQLRMGGYRSLR